MNRFATTCLGLALAFGLAASAIAQPHVTIREINDIPDENLAQLIELGETASAAQVEELTAPTLLNEEVTFTAVVLTNPYNSGLASWNASLNRPGRIHVFVRDTTARSQGYEGMGMQIVDGSGIVESLVIGDVADFTGTVTRFGTTIQFAPSAFQVIDQITDPNDPLLQPVVVSTEDVNRFVAEGDPFDRMQINWANFEALNNQYVRFENAQVINSIQADQGRPAYLVSSPGTPTLVDSYDISLRYRNDRAGVYQPPYNVRPANDPFIPPPAGAFVNLQGFLVSVGSNFNYPGLGVPNGTVLSIAPFADSDLEVLVSAPVISALPTPTEVLGEGDAFTVSVTVEPDPTRTITSVELRYTLSSGGGEQSVPMTNTGGDTYEATIPPAGDGVFVTYYIVATDSEGLESTSPTRSYRVLFDGINAIEDVQLTATAGPGSSPFTGLTTAMDIEAVVMSDPETSGFLMIQDDAGLAPWSGVFVQITLDIAGLNLQRGDRIRITEATIAENFSVTELQNATLERTGTGEPYAYKVVPTGALAQDPGAAEAHEGMAIRFENVTVTHTNADGPDDQPGFGEFQISSDGTEANQVRVDDSSDGFPTNYNENLENGEQFAFVQGMWWFSFGNYKLLPESLDDLGLTVDAEGGAVAGAFRLEPAYPNPVAGTATVRFSLAEAGRATVAVYDVVGRQVATLADADLAADVHAVTFDGRGLAAGVYFVRLQAGDRATTQKLVLVK